MKAKKPTTAVAGRAKAGVSRCYFQADQGRDGALVMDDAPKEEGHDGQ
jgi:hypothetical protein